MEGYPDDVQQLDLACPDCGGGSVGQTLSTLSGAYCRCFSCGHLWHVDRRRTDSPPLADGRRNTDHGVKKR
jgi:uncharacterized Zn finger protein